MRVSVLTFDLYNLYYLGLTVQGLGGDLTHTWTPEVCKIMAF